MLNTCHEGKPRPGRFTPGKETQYAFTEGWMSLGTGLDGTESLAPHRGSFEARSITKPCSYKRLVNSIKWGLMRRNWQFKLSIFPQLADINLTGNIATSMSPVIMHSVCQNYLQMSGELHFPAALSPEGRRADTSSPPSLEEQQNLVTKLREVHRSQSVHGKRPSRQTDNLEAHGRYQWWNNFLNSAAGDRISITGGVCSSLCLQSLIKFLFYVIAMVLRSLDHLLQ